MFKGRSQFPPPQIQGYVRPKMETKSDMKNESLQKPQTETKGGMNTFESKNVATANPTVDHKYNIILSEPNATDAYMFWTKTLTSQVSGQYARKLIMKAQQWFVRDIQGSAIVGKIDILIDNVPGFYDNDGIETTTVGSLFLSQISQIVDDVGIRTYNLVYQQSQDIFWDIPMNITSLKLRVAMDGQLINQKIDQPLNLQFDIRHMGK